MLTRIAVWAARLIVGLTFVVSGMAKMIDPYGSVNKFNDYFAAWGMEGFFPEGFVLLAACGLAMAEFLTGFTLATGSMRRTSAVCASAIMAVMLPLSAYIWLESPVEDCGCFGDFLIISNAATFWKNVLLSALCVFLLLRNRRARCLFAPWIQWVQIVVAAAYCAFIGIVGYHEQPLVDFRPYPVGSTLADDSADDLDSVVYLYRSPRGEIEEFDAWSLPSEDEGWEFIESRGAVDSGRTFAIFDPVSGEDITAEVLGAEPEQLFMLIPDLEQASVGGSYAANELASRTSLIALVDASLEAIDHWRDLSMADYPVFLADERTLKTVARGKVALVMTRDGVIRWKRTLSSVDPDVDSLDVYAVSGPDRFRLYTLLALAAEAAVCFIGYLPRQFRLRRYGLGFSRGRLRRRFGRSERK